MDYFTKNKMLFWCVIALVILNVLTLTAFWMGRPPRGQRPPGHNRAGQNVLEDKLQLTDIQSDKFEQIRQKHFSVIRPMQDDMLNIQIELVHEIFNAKPDQEKIKNLLAQLEIKHGQFETQLIQHFQQLRDVCNADQMEELKNMLINLVESTRPIAPVDREQQGPPGEPGPGHRPPPRR
ncbi:MAG: periplasmic heavy metal sensor [Phycisphaerae bacterium]|nr:periplasmic heavy metal sensor [Phycisphaerae bacterium]